MARVWSWIKSKIQGKVMSNLQQPAAELYSGKEMRGEEMRYHQQEPEKDRSVALRAEALGKQLMPDSAISHRQPMQESDSVIPHSYNHNNLSMMNGGSAHSMGIHDRQQQEDKIAQDFYSDMKMRREWDSDMMSDHQQQPEKDRAEILVELRQGTIDVPPVPIQECEISDMETGEIQWRSEVENHTLSAKCDMKMMRDRDRAEKDREEALREGQARQQPVIFTQQSYNHDNLKLLQDVYLSIMKGGSAHHDPENVTITQEKSPMGNTVLHIAAMYGNDEWVEKTAEQAQSHLLIAQNNKGDTPLHVAARTGHISTLKRLFILHLNSLPFLYYTDPKMDVKSTFLVKNNQGNNFFHEAIYNGHEGVISLLFSDEQLKINAGFKDLVDRIAITQTNNESKSVLYLAVEAGYKEFVNQALVKLYHTNPEDKKLFDVFFPKGHVVAGKSPLLAAILQEDQGILDIILERMPEWIRLTDDEGRTPLHHAASIGYLDGVKYLLGKCVTCASVRDKDGFFPLHLASDGGHVKVVEKLLEIDCCPYLREMLDNGGRNILHLAIQNGKLDVVRYILKASNSNTELKEMINDKDNEGNTPLHMASLRCYPRIVHELTWDKRVNLKLVNNMNHSALDACNLSSIENPSLRQRLTWTALKSAGVPSRVPLPITTKVPSKSTKSYWNHKAPKMDNFKDSVNTLLLVSTLIITATFAAGFAMPGGINSSDPGKGMSLLLHRVCYKLFIFCITISMYGAISTTIILIWAQLGDITLALLALKVAIPILGITLATLSIAFLAGVHLVITDLSWLATTSLVMSVIFILILLLLYFLLWLPSSSSIPIVRYISYYPFLFFASLVDQDKTNGNRKHLHSCYSVAVEL